MAPPTARRGPTAGGSAGPITALATLAAVGAVWVGATAGAWTRGTPGPGNPIAYVILLARGQAIWPGPVATAVTVVLGSVVAAAAWWARVRSVPGGSGRHVQARARYLAQPADLPGLTRTGAAVRARQFRPSLQGQKKPLLAETGLVLGDLMPRGVPVVAAFEDVLLAVMAPRAGKTTSLAVPAILDAPGPVAVTSNKADVVHLTAGVRARTGRVWRFDCQGITHTPQLMWWNPLASVNTIGDARLLASHFMQEVSPGGSESDFWANASLTVLATLLLAAGVSDGTLRDVWRWINASTGGEPSRRLRAHGLVSSAEGLEGTGSGAPETREGIYENVRAACACLADDRIMAWVTPPPEPPQPADSSDPADPADDPAGVTSPTRLGPPPGRPSGPGPARPRSASRLPEFSPTTFLASRDTLYLLSHSDAGAAQPLVAALVDELLRTGVQTAEQQPNLRLDPPLVCVLDEAANVCKIRTLPELYSHLGSRSIVPITILQSYKQAELVWGQTGAQVLWSAATIKLIGAGIDDPRLGDTVSTLIGDHDVTTTSVSTGGRGGGRSQTTSVTRERILTPADVRTIPKGWAVLFATGTRPGLLRLRPWYTGPRKTEVAAAEHDAQAAMLTVTTAAVAAAPADKPGPAGGPGRPALEDAP